MVKYNLVTDAVEWIARYPFGIDSISLTPDGSTIYAPRHGTTTDGVLVIDAASGAVTATVPAFIAGHNSVVSLDGSHAYVGGFSGANTRYLHQIDTTTNSIGCVG